MTSRAESFRVRMREASSTAVSAQGSSERPRGAGLEASARSAITPPNATAPSRWPKVRRLIASLIVPVYHVRLTSRARMA